jgi:hypothetical protein
VQWERDATLGRTVLGLDWALSNRAWGARVDHARLFFSWIARRHRL